MVSTKQIFGGLYRTHLDLTPARVIVDFDANFMQDHPTSLRNSKQFAAGRKPDDGHMNRLYVYENTFSITGGMADHRFPTAHGDIAAAETARVNGVGRSNRPAAQQITERQPLSPGVGVPQRPVGSGDHLLHHPSGTPLDCQQA